MIAVAVLAVVALIVVGAYVAFLLLVVRPWVWRAEDRAIAETAAATFERDFIPEAADVSPAELKVDAALDAVRGANS